MLEARRKEYEANMRYVGWLVSLAWLRPSTPQSFISAHLTYQAAYQIESALLYAKKFTSW